MTLKHHIFNKELVVSDQNQLTEQDMDMKGIGITTPAPVGDDKGIPEAQVTVCQSSPVYTHHMYPYIQYLFIPITCIHTCSTCLYPSLVSIHVVPVYTHHLYPYM